MMGPRRFIDLGVLVGGCTFLAVNGTDWRFDPDMVFAALRNDRTEQRVEPRGPRRLAGLGFADAWDVKLSDDLNTIVISAPPGPMIELVAWVRAFVPADVELLLFEDQLSFDPAPLPPGITAEQVRSRFFPDAWMVERMSQPGPPSLAERLRSTKPPRLP